MGSSWKKGWWNENPEATGSDPLTITGKMADAKSTMKRGWVLQSHLPNMCDHTHTHTQLGVTWDGSWVICSGRGWLDQQKCCVLGEGTPEMRATLSERNTCRDWVVYMPGLTRILVTVSRVSPRSYLSTQEWKCRGYGWRGRLDLLRTSGNVDSMWCPPTDHVVQIPSKAFHSLELLNLVVTLSCFLFF